MNSFFSFLKKSVGFLLFLFCSWAIYHQALSNAHWNQFSTQFHSLFFEISFYKWVILFLLMGANFIVESIKWKNVVEDASISLLNALKGVLVGQTFAFFTPNRIGEYAGRTLYLKSENKLMGIAQLGWASYAQLLVTISIGTIALYFNINSYTGIFGNKIVWVKLGIPLIGFFAFVLFFYKKAWEGKFRFLNRVQIDTNLKLNLLLLSLGRYFIFLLQYAWVASILKMSVPILPLLLTIAILFLLLSILPTISITELVIRGQLLLMLMSPIFSDKIAIISLSSIIWVVNFLIPSMIGAILLLGYRLNR